MLDFNSISTCILLIFIGFNIGVLSGFFGVGGSFIITPLLNILGLPMINAVGTGLTFAVIVSSFGGIRHYLAGNAIIKISLIVGFISFVGIRISQPLVIYLNRLNAADFYIRMVYIILLLVLGILTLRKRQFAQSLSLTPHLSLLGRIRNLSPQISLGYSYSPVSIWLIIGIALVVGFLQGFMGIGGGFILVPMYIIVLEIKTNHAVGTSLLTILISAVFASYLYFMAGKVIFVAALLMGLGAFFGVNFGVKATNHIAGETLKKFYAIFLILASLGIILKGIEMNNASLIYMLSLCVGTTVLIIVRFYFKFQWLQFYKK